MIEFSVVIKWCKRSHQRKKSYKTAPAKPVCMGPASTMSAVEMSKGIRIYIYIYTRKYHIYIYVCMYIIYICIL